MAKLNFLSLMLALFGGTASLPHILIRYYTVKDQAAARKSTVVGIAAIGFFYVLTLIMGLGAMTSGAIDVTNSNMAAPLLAKSFGELLFALISAIAFTTVLGTVAGLIVAASGAIVHDLVCGFGGVAIVRSSQSPRRTHRRGRGRLHRHRAGHRVQEHECQLSGRLGLQRGGQRQLAVAGDAAVLEAHDPPGHHGGDSGGHVRLAGLDSAERRHLSKTSMVCRRTGPGSVQPAGPGNDSARFLDPGRRVAADSAQERATRGLSALQAGEPHPPPQRYLLGSMGFDPEGLLRSFRLPRCSKVVRSIVNEIKWTEPSQKTK